VKMSIVKNVLEANDTLAEKNRQIFSAEEIYVINLMSSPGAGKTTLLEKTIEKAKAYLSLGVIEGDIAGSVDADRIRQHGIPVVQINTDGGCHLNARMIHDSLKALPLENLDLLFIENVGNLVCPARFHLGENEKVVILSVSEGHDKPLKYPAMFEESSALIVNKVDILPYVDVDIEKIKHDALMLNRSLTIFNVSCKTGEGLDKWIEYLMMHTKR
jgi:hydrogenase nickel incorporation protein HypB